MIEAAPKIREYFIHYIPATNYNSESSIAINNTISHNARNVFIRRKTLLFLDSKYVTCQVLTLKHIMYCIKLAYFHRLKMTFLNTKRLVSIVVLSIFIKSSKSVVELVINFSRI